MANPKPSLRPLPPAPIPLPGRATSPLWRLWLPLGLASVASSIALALWGGSASEEARPDPDIRFSEVSLEAGLAGEANEENAEMPSTPSTLGAGAVVFDYDGNGTPDLYLVRGGTWPWEQAGGRSQALAGALFRNSGGKFEDVTLASGIAPTFVGMAASAGDFDRDGRDDLVITGVEGLALYRNRGDGTFANVTSEAGLPVFEHSWRTGAFWLDVDRDGWLDLVILTFARWPEEVGLEEAIDVASGGRTYGTPAGFIGDHPSCFVNRRDGTFIAAADHAGLEIVDPETRRPRLGAASVTGLDANGDPWPDLLITYSAGDPVLFLGRQEGGFRRSALRPEIRREGDSYSQTRSPFEGARANDPVATALLRSWSSRATVEPESWTSLLAWDADRDGAAELVDGGGALEAQPAARVSIETLRGDLRLLRFRADSWSPLLVRYGERSPTPSLIRGLAELDFDDDGNPDLLATRWGSAPLLLRNDSRSTTPWLGVRLSANPGQPSPAGARIDVYTPRGVLSRMYLRQRGGVAESEATVHFGLALDSRVRRVVVRWPEGGESVYRNLQLNRVNTLSR